ncbi:hypothetical protein jhhlp_007455 [Lomentospora prolificans]|uniref:Heterokaryon incompatibility domain-containing protein n=1 Tax=Lomentospora prolificans TaxID=41688 RepID=A0A2N3N132_9PEZI|nr:hypothetical protein jhhlp_007455 [Lomentospora prolificans]
MSRPSWWVEDPSILSDDDPSFLCEVCRHINFRYLIYESPIAQIVEDIPLGPYSTLLQRQHCAFCRLTKCAIDNIFGVGVVPLEHNGKTVTIAFSTMLGSAMLDGSSPKVLSIKIRPSGINDDKIKNPEIQVVPDGSWLQGTGAGRPMQPSEVSSQLIFSWGVFCRLGVFGHSNGPSSTKSPHPLPSSFRVIDTKDNCILPVKSKINYLALSYVWGVEKPGLRLMGENYTDLCTEGSLLRFSDGIPQTIRDAMELVQKMNERYLWVDVLCIIQDDENDKMEQVAAMDRIYGTATLTIAAAFGEGPEAGLPGIRPGSRSWIQKTENIQGLSLVNRPKNFDSIERSRWNTRAWTYQERVLSSRIVFFGEQQTFYWCSHLEGYFSEDQDSKPIPRQPRSFRHNIGGPLPLKWSINIVTYKDALEAFTKRHITMAGDILNAFEGVAQRLYPLFRGGFIYGLPETELDYCLSWEAVDDLDRRRDAGGEPLFPSWSWAGWVGAINLNWKERLSCIKWVNKEDGREYSTADYRAPSTAFADETRTYQWLQEWKETRNNSTFHYFSHPDEPDTWFLHPTAPEAERRRDLRPAYHPTAGLLEFRASVARLSFKDWRAPDGLGSREGLPRTLVIYNDDGEVVGSMSIPVSLLCDIRENNRYSAILIAQTTLNPELKEMRARRKTNQERPVEDGICKAGPDEPALSEVQASAAPNGHQGDTHEALDQAELLVVEWRDNIAYRIGFGYMHVDDWGTMEPITQTVLLG